ncbi:hypothetical protein FQ186_20855 [Pseudomonas sp. ANT_H14]|uniref:hypothetical protein n=1 Tax=unclassified Pseudomonas TaxID=196821 RepID=UPI0011EDAE5E|nr:MULTISPECIES: hypothetical protein [unclassified Pseudomonas]KAA0943732.1 hypothetical protein FQ182_23630 [Pseudomonas sp. ANT_H4]KAA0950125.1 hypothetical protein FQ186_20855 [Pseudomonas sp. ANT_H14]
MGWFSSLVNGISSAVSAVVSVASTVVKKGKEMAAKAIGWLADEAETFVGDVQKVWRTVQPYISKVRAGLLVAAKAVPWPWAKALALGLERALAFVEQLDKHPIAENLQKAVEWIIRMAREIKTKILDDLEIQTAERNAVDIAEAMSIVPEEEKKALRASELVNNYLLVKTRVARAVSQSTVTDFEHYLRIRAAQKLLAGYEQIMDNLQSIENVDPDLFFIIEVSAGLISEQPHLSESQTERLDLLTIKLFGKPLVPFVFEEMIIAWALDVDAIEQQWAVLNKELAKDKVMRRRLELSQDIEPLTAEEQVFLSNLVISTDKDSQTLQALDTAAREKRNYVYASEGFLQLLEKDEATLIEEDREYLAEEGGEVGKLLIECAQNGRAWTSLTPDERALITDFANIFKADCKARGAAFKEVEVRV